MEYAVSTCFFSKKDMAKLFAYDYIVIPFFPCISSDFTNTNFSEKVDFLLPHKTVPRVSSIEFFKDNSSSKES